MVFQIQNSLKMKYFALRFLSNVLHHEQGCYTKVKKLFTLRSTKSSRNYKSSDLRPPGHALPFRAL